jgi:2',3'-cyclic-nucleotide 2'-phosphodiesterase (5'-nucleotidase family)
LGGLPRKATYIKEVRESGIDPIILDAGDALFSTFVLTKETEPESRLKAEAIAYGFQKFGADVLNVGGFDLAKGYDYLRQLADSLKLTYISANLIDATTGELVFPAYQIIEKGGLKVGIIGLTDLLPPTVKDLKSKDIIETGRQLIKELKQQVDVIVMLVNVERSQVENITSAFADADYIFTSRSTYRTRPGTNQLSKGPLVYASGNQGKYLTRVDLTILKPDSAVVDISRLQARLNVINRRMESLQKRDPEKPLEEIYADKPNLLKTIARYRDDKATLEKELQAATNRSVYTSVALSKKIKDDPEMLAFMDSVLAECEKVKPKKTRVLKSLNTKKSTKTVKLPPIE